MRRPTLRAQLTLLYAVPFVLSGAALLALPINQTDPASPATPPPPGGADDRDLSSLFIIGFALLALILVSVALGWFVAGRYLRPLRTITATARDISASNLNRRLDRSGRPTEFAELATTLDDLFARLEASFASQRHFVANASHELRTPLTAERALLQVALADPDATVDTLRDACREVLALGEAQERLIDALLTLATSEQGVERRERLDVADIASGVVAARAAEARRRGIHVELALSVAATVGDPRLVESLVANLVDNALRYNAPGGRVEIVTALEAGQASITVRNTGPVIPAEQLERLFQPFQQLGSQRVRHADGHGLGLAIVRAIVHAHDAVLVPRARRDGGLDISVIFPG